MITNPGNLAKTIPATQVTGLADIATTGDAADLIGTVPADHLPGGLGALSTVTPAAFKLPYFDSASTATAALLTEFTVGLLALEDAAAVRAYIEAGTGGGAVAWGDITGTPTTLAGYGITDAQALDADLTAIAALATTGWLKRTAANTWTLNATIPAAQIADLAAVATTGSASDLGAGTLPSGRLPSPLAALHGLTVADGDVLLYTGAATATTFATTSYGRSLAGAADADAALLLLGITPGSLDASWDQISDKPALVLSLAALGSGTGIVKKTGADTLAVGPLEAADIPGLATVAFSGSADDIDDGTLAAARLPATIAAMAAATPAANQQWYWSSATTGGLYTVSAFSRVMLTHTTAAFWRTELQLGTSATLNVGTTAGTVAAGNDSRLDVAATTHAATSKTTPADADEVPLIDSAASFVLKRLTWANLKATLKTYTDSLYDAIGAAATVAGDLATHAGLTTTAHGGLVASSDARLTDARTPTAHKASHATGGSDAIAPADIGAATTAAFTTTTAGLVPAPGTAAGKVLGDGGTWVAQSGGASLSDATPLVGGTAAAGTASTASRSDHVHPAAIVNVPQDVGASGNVTIDLSSGAEGQIQRHHITLTGTGNYTITPVFTNLAKYRDAQLIIDNTRLTGTCAVVWPSITAALIVGIPPTTAIPAGDLIVAGLTCIGATQASGLIITAQPNT